jgi:hypothetical protein
VAGWTDSSMRLPIHSAAAHTACPNHGIRMPRAAAGLTLLCMRVGSRCHILRPLPSLVSISRAADDFCKKDGIVCGGKQAWQQLPRSSGLGRSQLLLAAADASGSGGAVATRVHSVQAAISPARQR